MPDGSQAFGVDSPHYLGPTIVASKDKAGPDRLLQPAPDGRGRRPVPPDGYDTDGVRHDAGVRAHGPGRPAQRHRRRAQPDVHGEVLQPRDARHVLHREPGHAASSRRRDPWISDGTPHQWITPANETTPWPQGVAVQNVPDMVGAGAPADVPRCDAANDGCQTFYYTNEQSARLMFYHDHAWGITRLNVYAGEAAGYVITDPTEQKLIGTGGALAGLGLGTPLVIQDRTFVPSAEQLAGQDPTWDAPAWGGMGDLWYHHVYMPAQNPGDPSGMSAYGRWMYGPWFWPPATPQNGPIAQPVLQHGPERPRRHPRQRRRLHDVAGDALQPRRPDDLAIPGRAVLRARS